MHCAAHSSVENGSLSPKDDQSKLAALVSDQCTVADPDIRVGLVGRGIGASLTPVMHRREGERLGLRYEYSLIDFDALSLADSDLGSVVDRARELGFSGLNVTYPFKQRIIGLLDRMSDDAAAIGAVNTVVFGERGLIGYNTDCWGFAENFRRTMAGAPITSVMQLGAGGAGAAVAHGLLELGVEHLIIFDVDVGKAEGLRDKLEARFCGKVSAVPMPELAVTTVDGVVNTTPVGMAKLPGMPLDPGLFRPTQWFADIIYFPRETELLVAARKKGCRVLPGGGMAIFQAVKAFELFSGRLPDAGEMARTFQAEA